MIDLKGKTENMEVAGVGSKPAYPWGTQITLEKKVLEALGIDIKRFPVGQKVKLVCNACVTEVSSREGTDGKNEYIRLQIEKMNKPTVQNRRKAGVDLINGIRG